MLNRYQSIVPTGVVVAEARRLAEFFPTEGDITTVTLVTGANVPGDTRFDVRVDEVSIYATDGDKPVIEGGQQTVVQLNLAEAVALGQRVTVYLDDWPVAGLAGPCAVEVGVDDGIEVGVTDNVLPLETYVRAYFQGSLGRQPDGTELPAHLFDLTNGCYDIEFVDVAQGLLDDIFTGAEFLALATTNTQFVTALYRSYFNREPDATGLAFHVGLLTGGTSRAVVRASFASHREFINRSALYCRNQLQQADAVRIDGAAPATYVDGRADTRIAAALAAIGAASADITAALVLKTTGVAANTYGSATTIPVIQVDAKGRVIAATTADVSAGGQASYGADATPAVPGVLDEEFNGPTMNALYTKTVQNSNVGSIAPAHDQNVTIPSHFYVKLALAGQAINFRANAPAGAATGDFSITAKVTVALRAATPSIGAGVAVEADSAAFTDAVRAYWQVATSTIIAVGLDSQTGGTWTFFPSGQRDTLPNYLTGLVLHLQRVGNVWSAWFALDGGRSFTRTGDSTITKSFTVASIVVSLSMSGQTMPMWATIDWIRYNWRTF